VITKETFPHTGRAKGILTEVGFEPTPLSRLGINAKVNLNRAP
jgi:hypothetical protein